MFHPLARLQGPLRRRSDVQTRTSLWNHLSDPTFQHCTVSGDRSGRSLVVLACGESSGMSSDSDRFSTGVPGLDTILGGGVFEGGIYIIQGAPGAGKTILGNQICFAQAAQGRNALYITLLAESHARMIGHMRRHDVLRRSRDPRPDVLCRRLQDAGRRRAARPARRRPARGAHPQGQHPGARRADHRARESPLRSRAEEVHPRIADPGRLQQLHHVPAHQRVRRATRIRPSTPWWTA